MSLKIVKINKNAVVPKYQSMYASGFDLHTLIDEKIWAKSVVLVPTGLIFQIPHGCEVQIRPRSGISCIHPNYIANSPGTIDSDYRGEIKIAVYNALYYDWEIPAGTRIAQAVVTRVEHVNIIVVDELTETKRGAGGFGSTGNE